MTFQLLLVDDSEPVRTRLCCLLESIPGVTAIDQAATLGEAMAHVRSDPPTMVILDLSLPDGFGLDIIAPLRRIVPHLLIAILTLHGESGYRQMCLARGANWFFDKAREMHLLLDRVRQQAAEHAHSPINQGMKHAPL